MAKSSVRSRQKGGEVGIAAPETRCAAVVEDKVTILTIDEVPRGPNGPTGLLRLHWAKRRKYNERWAWLIRSAVGNVALVERKAKAKVTIIQHRKALFDPDNLYTSCKPLLDGLRRWGLIEDDDEKHCDLHVAQVRDKEQYTKIYIQ